MDIFREESVNRMANEMVRAGVTLFIAAGNSGGTATIGTPGSAEDVITVGSLDKDTAIAVYSSQGPTEEGRVKPNLRLLEQCQRTRCQHRGRVRRAVRY